MPVGVTTGLPKEVARSDSVTASVAAIVSATPIVTAAGESVSPSANGAFRDVMLSLEQAAAAIATSARKENRERGAMKWSRDATNERRLL